MRKPNQDVLDNVRKAVNEGDYKRLTFILDELKGSYAAMYLSIVLLETSRADKRVEITNMLKKSLLS